MLSGVGMDRHGIRFNAHRPERGRIVRPTVLTLAKRAGLHTSMFVGKLKLEHLLMRDDEVERFAARGVFCRRVNRRALPYLAAIDGGVHFVHYADVDGAGHVHGWMSDRYIHNVARADRCLGDLVSVLEQRGDLSRTLLIVTSDHGGHGRTHGTPQEEDRHIPWIAWGGRARPGARPAHVDTRDTAATVLHAAGLAQPNDLPMEGQAVLGALR
jgi:hypothetical protein